MRLKVNQNKINLMNNFTLNGNAISNNNLLRHEIIERLNLPKEWILGVPSYAPYDSTYSINKTFLKKENEFIKFVEKNFQDYSEIFFPDDVKAKVGFNDNIFVNYFCQNNDRRIVLLGLGKSYEERPNLKLLDFCSSLYFEFLKQAQKKFNKKFDDLSLEFFDRLFDLCITELCGNAYTYITCINGLGIKRRNNMLGLVMNEWYD